MADKYIDLDFEDYDHEIGSPKTAVVAITGATAANPVVITAPAHGLALNDVVAIRSVVGMVEINDRVFSISGVGTNSFALTGEDGTGHTAYTSGGTATSLPETDGSLRIFYDDTVEKDMLADAVQRAKEYFEGSNI